MPRTSISLARSGRPHMMRARVARPRKPERGPMSASPSVGNRSLGRMLGSLRVGGAADRFETEAKAFSGRVPVAGHRPYAPGLSHVGGDGGGVVRDDIAERIRGISGGQPLPEHVKRPLEGTHRTGLGGIRMHTGPEAEELTRAVGARAMTLDNHIFYGRGASPSDMSLTSEEVVHTMQQGAVPTSRSVGRAPRGVIQRDVPISGSHKTRAKFLKTYFKKGYDDVDMGQFKVMTPDSKQTLGTLGMAPCAGLAIAVKTPKGWCAGMHHLPGGTGDLVKSYKTLKGMVDEAAEPYGTVSEEVRYLIPGSSTRDEHGEKFEDEIGRFDNDWRSLKASYAKGTSSVAIAFERTRGWMGGAGLKLNMWTVGS